VFPVPAKDYIYIDSDTDLSSEELHIIGTNGELVQSLRLEAGVAKRINVSNYVPWLYFIVSPRVRSKFVVGS
jgi:hypothetical protein